MQQLTQALREIYEPHREPHQSFNKDIANNRNLGYAKIKLKEASDDNGYGYAYMVNNIGLETIPRQVTRQKVELGLSGGLSDQWCEYR